jgi:hypothetical protein
MPDVLSPWHDAFTSHKQEARTLVESHPRDVLNRQPDPMQWSACQILAHLNVTAAMLVPKLREAVKRFDNPDSLGRLDGFFERDARNQGIEDDGVRLVPPFDHDPHELLERFENFQDDLIELASAGISAPSDEHSGRSVASWLEGTWAHQARHLSEARTTVAQLETA